MERSNTSRFQMWLILFLLALALVLSLVIIGLLRERSASRQPEQPISEDIFPPASTRTGAPPIDETAQAAALPALPTPTFVPVAANVPGPEPTAAIAAPQQPQVAPTVAPPAPSPVPTPPPVTAAGTRVRLDDDVWQGGYRSVRGYGGRSATWIYGAGTAYNTMQAAVVLDTQPRETAVLTIEGMDSEDRPKTTIQITVNNTEIYRGPNPLPNDDLPLESGTWSQASFPFDAALLQPGTNTIQISNLRPGEFSLPPFFMLDYAVLSFDPAGRAAP